MIAFTVLVWAAVVLALGAVFFLAFVGFVVARQILRWAHEHGSDGDER